ncbi:phosphate ABC transporter substrate-binding protein [Paenibacillus sp. 1011MAR3C5]|uniref:phosphate ABC transporter substrate-binding protein n=1 Tax=Paenibacillus sp. 1011MAR3C5 TaxID=1675787 RepID=UPI000E6D0F67|nr:phosphate ABC transporter substrate-binding protein [Paenibacillus sp. 1011MAR3C5]RJE84694.1 phosphate ABC transporter substrate-binding protein [Paenibacillus sp. 1011MAR3C5]
MKKTVMLIMAMVLTFTLAACGQNTNNGGNASTPPATNNAGNASTEPSNEPTPETKLEGSILATGSSALQPLVDQASKAFMDANSGVTIQVQGGGSGTGLTQVSEGQADIGNSDVYAEEKLDADKSAELVDHQVAVVAMAAVVNPKVNVDTLTKQQLIDIFTGKVTNWKELGGDDQKIVIVNRPASSGTRATFEKYALGTKTDDLQGSIQEDSSGTVRKIIGETPGAIGYLALSYLDDSIKTIAYEGVAANEENVANGTYPVWAYEHMYTKGEPSAVVKAFLDYMMTDEVQDGAVVELGYIPAKNMQVVRDIEGNITKK